MLYIATLDEIKAILGIEDSRDDDALTLLLEGLQSRFDDHLNRTLLRGENVEEIFDGEIRMVCLQRYPVESVASVVVGDTALDTDEYVVNKVRGRLHYGAATQDLIWPRGNQNITVVYTGGYLACGSTAGAGQTVMPDAIRRAIFIQAGFEWRNREHLGQKSVGAQGTSVALADAKLLPETLGALLDYERYS